ncbi:50S ribosomal protein L4 [Candidatus Vidania fulgoroideorum]
MIEILMKFNYKKHNLTKQYNNIYISNIRKNISKQKNRGEISFSNKKPWKQKGTGCARSGRRSSPIWRKGGRCFPNGNENFKKNNNKKIFYCLLPEIINKKIFLVNEKNEYYIKNKERFYKNFIKPKLINIINLNIIFINKKTLKFIYDNIKKFFKKYI